MIKRNFKSSSSKEAITNAFFAFAKQEKMEEVFNNGTQFKFKRKKGDKFLNFEITDFGFTIEKGVDENFPGYTVTLVNANEKLDNRLITTFFLEKGKKHNIQCELMKDDDLLNGGITTNTTNGAKYSIEGVRGRHIDVFDDKAIITTKVGIASLLTGNATDGEKTIYYCDVIGVQFKKSATTIGYLQLETASSAMNNKSDNFFNENSFTFDTSKVSNEKMEEVVKYIKGQIDALKASPNNAVSVQPSSADELLKYKQLLDMDVITQEEFEAKKKELLGI